MYVSFKSVSAKNGKTLTPTRTRNFFVDRSGLRILRRSIQWISVRKTNCTTHWILTHEVNMKARPEGQVAIGHFRAPFLRRIQETNKFKTTASRFYNTSLNTLFHNLVCEPLLSRLSLHLTEMNFGHCQCLCSTVNRRLRLQEVNRHLVRSSLRQLCKVITLLIKGGAYSRKLYIFEN